MWSTLREYLPLFILGYTGSSLLCSGFLSLQRVGTSHCGGFSCGARALGTWALSTCYSQAFQQEDSIVVAHGLSYACLGNPTENGAWQATVYGVAKESDVT